MQPGSCRAARTIAWSTCAPSPDYAAYHIPTAENVTVAALPEFPFLRTEKIVLYSDGGIHAAQAWMLMQAQGYRAVYTVLGGLEGWKDDVLYPALPGAGVGRGAR